MGNPLRLFFLLMNKLLFVIFINLSLFLVLLPQHMLVTLLCMRLVPSILTLFEVGSFSPDSGLFESLPNPRQVVTGSFLKDHTYE
jgi:hypothetical protein